MIIFVIILIIVIIEIIIRRFDLEYNEGTILIDAEMHLDEISHRDTILDFGAGQRHKRLSVNRPDTILDGFDHANHLHLVLALVVIEVRIVIVVLALGWLDFTGNQCANFVWVDVHFDRIAFGDAPLNLCGCSHQHGVTPDHPHIGVHALNDPKELDFRVIVVILTQDFDRLGDHSAVIIEAELDLDFIADFNFPFKFCFVGDLHDVSIDYELAILQAFNDARKNGFDLLGRQTQPLQVFRRDIAGACAQHNCRKKDQPTHLQPSTITHYHYLLWIWLLSVT